MLEHGNYAPENQAPATTSGLSTEAHNLTHRPQHSMVVQKGETLGEIAQHHLGKGADVHDVYNYVNKIGHANKIKDVNHIEAGQTLHFPPIHGHHNPDHKPGHMSGHKPDHKPDHKSDSTDPAGKHPTETRPAHDTPQQMHGQAAQKSAQTDTAALHRRPHAGKDATMPAVAGPVAGADSSVSKAPTGDAAVAPAKDGPKSDVTSSGTGDGVTKAPVTTPQKLDVAGPTDSGAPKTTTTQPADAVPQPAKAPDAPVVSAPLASFAEGAKNEVVNHPGTVIGTGVAAAAIGAAMRFAPTSVKWGAAALGGAYLGYQAWSQGGNVLKAVDVASDPGYYSRDEVTKSNDTFKSLGGTAVDVAAAGIGAGVTTGVARRMISSGYGRVFSTAGVSGTTDAAAAQTGEAATAPTIDKAPVTAPIAKAPVAAPIDNVPPSDTAAPAAQAPVDTDNWTRLHQTEAKPARSPVTAPETAPPVEVDNWTRLHQPEAKLAESLVAAPETAPPVEVDNWARLHRADSADAPATPPKPTIVDTDLWADRHAGK